MMPVAEPSWRKKRTPCPFYKTGRCIFSEKCNFVHDGEIDYKQVNMRAAVPPYRRTPENSVDSFSSSEDEDDRLPRHPIDEHTAAAPSLVFSSIYGQHPNLHPTNLLQLSEVDLPVSPESLPETPGRVQRRPSASSRASAIHSLAVSSPASSRAPSRPVSASLGIGLGGRGQGLAEVFTALATSQAHATALPPSSAGESLPSPLSLSPQSPGAQDVVVPDDNYTLEQFPFKLALSNQSSLLLNRTTRAAERENARRASSLPQTSDEASPAAKQSSNYSAPDRFDSVVLVPPADFSFERPSSYTRSRSTSHHSDVPLDADEEEDDVEVEDEEEEDEQEIVKEHPSFEALQPYPRDVSIEPSPDPAQEGFGASTAVPDSVHERRDEEDEDEPRQVPRRMDSDRKLDHERLLIELEERLNIDPSKRRARSATTTTRASQKSATVVERKEKPREEAKVVVPKSGVDMDAARGMLGAMFAKRGLGSPLPTQSQVEEETEEAEDEEDEEEEDDDEEVFKDLSQTFKDDDKSLQEGDDLDLSLSFDPGPSSVRSGSSRSSSAGQSLSFLPADWDIGSLDLDAHPLGLGSVDAVGGLASNGPVSPNMSNRLPSPGLSNELVPSDASRSLGSPSGLDSSNVPSDSSLSNSIERDRLEGWEREEHTPMSGQDDQELMWDQEEPVPVREQEAHASTPERDEPVSIQEPQHRPVQEWEDRQQTFDIRESGHYSEWRHAEEDVYDSEHSAPEYEDEHDEHLSHSDFSSDEEAEVQAVMESSVILRREVPRETSLPEARSRMGSLKSRGEPEIDALSEEDEHLDGTVLDEDLTRVTNASLASTMPEDDLTHRLEVEQLDENGLATAVSGKMVRAETVSASSLVFELPRVESTPVVQELPDADVEQEAHEMNSDERDAYSAERKLRLDERNADVKEQDTDLGAKHAPPDDHDIPTLGDLARLDHQDANATTPIPSPSPEIQLPVVTPHTADPVVPAVTARSPSPGSDARTTSISTEAKAEAEPSKRRSQLKPLRLSLLYGLKTPTSASITPISAHSPTPIASNFTVPSPQPEPYPTPATAHPTHAGSGTARSIPSVTSPNPRAAPSSSSLADVEEAEETVSVHGIGRGSFGPESVSWFGSKKGSTRGSLGDSMRRSVVRARAEDVELPFVSESPTGVIAPLSELVETPEDEDVRPLPVIWDDESETGSRNGSGDAGMTQSPSLSVPVLDVSRDELTPTAESVSSFQRYPAFVNVDSTSPLPSPRFMGSARASPEPTSRPASRARKPPESVEELESVRAESVRATTPLRETELSNEPRPEQKPAIHAVQEPETVVKVELKQEPSQEHQQEPQAETTDLPAERSRKWGDQSDDSSIGSLPAFDTPAPPANPPQEEPSAQPDGRPIPRSNRQGYPRYHYPPLPDTAPLSISPRNVTPSMMQREQDQGLELDQEPFRKQIPWATPPLTAPLHLQMKMRAQQGETGSSPWMADYFVNSPSSLHSSQMGSMHSASSSVTTADKVVGAEQSVVETRQPTKISSLKAKTFGDPGPGPSTMMTYSARQQSIEALGSPISLRSSRHSRVASLINEPEITPPKSHTPSRGTSRQNSVDQNDVTIVKMDEEPTVKISSEEPTGEMDFSPRSVSTRHPRLHSPLRNTVDGHYSPSGQSVRFKSSPNGRSPITPLPDHSPLNILRRNLATRPGSVSPGFLSPQPRLTNLPETRSSRHQHHGSLAAPPMTRHEDLRNGLHSAPLRQNRQSLTPATRFGAASPRPGSPTFSVQSAVSQTKPLLFFAIAKNSAQEVERLLQEGEVEPNDKAGPDDLPALAFTLANEQLTDKTQIVKSLLSHGADPASVLDRKSGSGDFDDAELALSSRIEQGINPAIRYYLNRKRMTIPALQAELLEKNNFGALTRAGFSIIGQDAALDELIRVVAGHCRRTTLNPLVIVFSGGPGCGKSLLASKIGPLLHVPYFTVNMTNLRNEGSLWQYISMTTKAGSPQVPLVDFLRVNEGQRCVVVLEEIEKAADKTVWHSLLMPWEWGKATVISPTTNEQIDIDTSKVIWIATSNSGDDATLKFFAERTRPSHTAPGESALTRLAHRPRENDQNFTRKDYLQLMQAVRKRLGELLGSSMISRVSSVLPFLPFTEAEVLALASESLSALREAQKPDQDLEDVDWESLLQQAVGEYIPGEGARSVHRAVQRAFDEITEW